MEKEKRKILYTSSKQIVYIALMAALLIIGKLSLAVVPNIEVVTTLTIVFAYTFGWPALGATFIFCAVDNLLYPPAIDVTVSYFIYWNLLAFVIIIIKMCGVKSEIPYLLTGLVMTLLFGVLTSGTAAIFYNLSFWAVYSAGMVFFVLHLLSTLVFMSVAFKPLTKLLKKLRVNSIR